MIPRPPRSTRPDTLFPSPTLFRSHLYPGSQIANMAVDAKGDKGGAVTVDFDSPADPATVLDWFNGKLGAAGFSLTTKGNGLVGTTDEGKPFRLDLAPAAGAHAPGKDRKSVGEGTSGAGRVDLGGGGIIKKKN